MNERVAINSRSICFLTVVLIVLVSTTSCTTTRDYQVNLVDGDGDLITSVTRSVGSEKAYIDELDRRYTRKSDDPADLNRYLTDAKLFADLYQTSDNQTYVAWHGFFAAMMGVRRPPIDNDAFIVEREYVRHGFTAEAVYFLNRIDGSIAPSIPAEEIRSVLLEGVWYGEAMEAFADSVLHSIELDTRKRQFAFNAARYADLDGELANGFPKWYRDVSAHLVATATTGSSGRRLR
jgi:hypothetical protein